jgi:hypothetical protein
MKFSRTVIGLGCLFFCLFGWGCRKSGCENPNDDYYADEFYSACEPGATLYKFLGSFAANEVCGATQNAYELRIASPDTVNYRVIIENIYDTNGSFPLSAQIKRNEITIPQQEVNGVTFRGSGKIAGQSLTLNYRLSNSLLTDSCSCSAVKIQ